jgi:hypothetical protein
MSGKLTALTYTSRYTVRHAVTLKWLSIVFVRLIQSERIVTATVKYGTATARHEFAVFVPTHTKSTGYFNQSHVCLVALPWGVVVGCGATLTFM